jgi:hypothetical protein
MGLHVTLSFIRGTITVVTFVLCGAVPSLILIYAGIHKKPNLPIL